VKDQVGVHPVSQHRRRRLARRAVLGLGLALLCTACTSSPAVRSGTSVGVAVRDFQIQLARSTVRAGGVSFDLYNHGPSTHEFVAVQTDLSDANLPVGPDGLSVDENAPQIHVVAEDSELDIGESRVLTVDLPPGHYVLYCNLQGHYLGGMHASLVAT
jgi:hypothetical protein